VRLIVLLTLLFVVAPRADVLAADPTCAYMDRLKRVWDATEPSTYETRTLRQLASQFQEGTVERPELATLDAVLAGFAKKVDRRTGGTRAAQPPAAARNVHRLGLEFLARVDETVRLSRRLVQEMRSATPDAALIERGRDRLQRLDREVRRLGGLFNSEVVRIRNTYRCGPP
jgi:hypothetical protein